MSLGIAVRSAAGPLEPKLADLYRAFFFDVEDFAARLAELDRVQDVLEIGCGEGAVLTALSRKMPMARFIGIDTSPAVGRLFAGDRSRTEFQVQTAQRLAEIRPAWFDLVLIGDVLHHVPAALQPEIIRAAVALVRPGGRLVVKEWIRKPTIICLLGYLSDRLITGDRIRYLSRDQWLTDVLRSSPEVRLEQEWSLRPWASNHAMVFRVGAPK